MIPAEPLADRRPVLVLGATGTTGKCLVAQLIDASLHVRAASRVPPPAAAPGIEPVRFDWSDPGTHAPALAGARAVYLVPPPADPDLAARMIPLVERLADAGVERATLLSSSAIPTGAPALGQVHAALAASSIGWAVLRPSWFMQNLWNRAHHVGAAVHDGREFLSATGTARIAFIDAGDIARVAARTLLDPEPVGGDLILTGPEALSYDDAAAVLSKAVGRSVSHRGSTSEEVVAFMTAAGVGESFAQVLARLEQGVAAGAEDRVTDTVAVVTGTPPRSLRAVLAAERPFQQERAA